MPGTMWGWSGINNVSESNMTKSVRSIISATTAVLAIITALLLTGFVPQPTLLNRVKQKGELVVVTRLSPTTYYEGANGPAGFEYDLARLFADYLGVKLRIVVPDSFNDILPMLNNGRADLAAAGLTITKSRRDRVRFGPPYQEIRQQLVYRAGNETPLRLADLRHKYIEVVAGSSHEDTLRRLDRTVTLNWHPNYEAEVEELLSLVWQRELDYTIADSNQIEISRRYYPELRVAFDLSGPQQLAWAFRKGKDISLHREATRFFAEIEENGVLDQLKDRYFGHVHDFDYVGTRTFIKHIQNRLPQYDDYFVQAADDFNLDWRLLAAIGYQESHWNPRAISPTGVRGIMMLTRTTAADMGISNRIKPRNSIFGGARYFAGLKKAIPDSIAEPDRTWFALAAYNLGLGHVSDAREITRRLGKDPDKWMDVRDSLPLLMQKRWYKQTQHGYARGMEAVQYVENIRDYFDILVWRTESRGDTPATLLVKYGRDSDTTREAAL